MAIDHMSPIKEATSFAGTARWFDAMAARSLPMLRLILAALDDVTLKRYAFRSTMVPSAFMACRGKKEHLEILSDRPKAADSKTMRIATFMAWQG